jgi:hypothetical protein
MLQVATFTLLGYSYRAIIWTKWRENSSDTVARLTELLWVSVVLGDNIIISSVILSEPALIL